MDVMSYTDTRARLREVMDRDVADHAPVIISRQKGGALVMVSLADWNAIEETMHLLSAPANSARLLAAAQQLEAGQGEERELIEP